jgi:hypothetical protein
MDTLAFTPALPPRPDEEPEGLGRRYAAGVRSLLDRAWCPVEYARVGAYIDPHADSYAWRNRAAYDTIFRFVLGDQLSTERREDGARVVEATIYAVLHETVGGDVGWAPLSVPDVEEPHVRYGVPTYAPAEVERQCVSTITVRSRAGGEETTFLLAREHAQRLLEERVIPALAAHALGAEPEGLVAPSE